MPDNVNPLAIALRVVFGPLVKQSSKWPPLLAYGLPGIVAVLLIVLLRPVVPDNLIWLLAVVILAPLVGYILTAFSARRFPIVDNAQRQQRPRATVDEPSPDQTVGRTIHCSGSATGVPPSMHLWLTVEATGFVWPKEGEVHVDKDNRWLATIFEDGAIKRFSVALLIANPEADKTIREWLEEGRSKGEYTEMKGIRGTERIARIDGLRLRRSGL
jgi:hypothetical protein